MNDDEPQICHVEKITIKELESLMAVLCRSQEAEKEYLHRSGAINFQSFDTDSHIPLLVTLLDERSGSNPAANNLYLVAGRECTRDIQEATYINQSIHFSGIERIESITIHNEKEAIRLENVIRELSPGCSYVMAGRIVSVPFHWAQRYEG